MKNKQGISESLIHFTEKFFWKFNFELTNDTRIEDDLRVHGDDIMDYLIAFAGTFKVDFSNFNFLRYFSEEASFMSINVIGIVCWLKGKKIMKASRPVTMGDLQNAIDAGMWMGFE